MIYPAQVKDGVVVISVKGKVMVGGGEIKLRETVRKYLDDGFRFIVLDMANASTIDSSGIGELLSSYTTATNRGARLALVGLPEKIRNILTSLGFIMLFDTYDNLEEAIVALRS